MIPKTLIFVFISISTIINSKRLLTQETIENSNVTATKSNKIDNIPESNIDSKSMIKSPNYIMNKLIKDIKEMRNITNSARQNLNSSTSLNSVKNWVFEKNTLEDKVVSAIFPRKLFFLVLEKYVDKVYLKFDILEENLLNHSKIKLPEFKYPNDNHSKKDVFSDQMISLLNFLIHSDFFLESIQEIIVSWAKEGESNSAKVVINDRIDTDFVGFLVKIQLQIDNLKINIATLDKLTRIIMGHPTIKLVSDLIDELGLNFKFSGEEKILAKGLESPQNKFNQMSSESNIMEDNSIPLSFNSTFLFDINTKN